MPEYYLWRKIRRISVWRDWNDSDRELALDEIHDAHVSLGRGFSLWRVRNEADRRVVAAVMFELSNTSSINKQDYFMIPATSLHAWGYQAQPTPDGTISSHRRAPDLHHDLLDLTMEDCQRLTGHLHDHFGDLYMRARKGEVKTAVKAEIEQFRSEQVRQRLVRACGL